MSMSLVITPPSEEEVRQQILSQYPHREIYSQIGTLVAVVDNTGKKGAALGEDLTSSSKPFFFMIGDLLDKMSSWNPASGDEACMKQLWLEMGIRIVQKNAENYPIIGDLFERVVAEYKDESRGKLVEPFEKAGLRLIPTQWKDINKQPHEITKERIKALGELAAIFLKQIQISEEFKGRIQNDLLMILCRREGEELIRKILYELAKDTNEHVQIAIVPSDKFELDTEQNPVTIHYSLLPLATIHETGQGRLSLFMPRFVGLAHELRHLLNFLENREEYERFKGTLATDPRNSTREEERVVAWEQQFLASYGMPERIYHWYGIQPDDTFQRIERIMSLCQTDLARIPGPNSSVLISPIKAPSGQFFS